MSNSTGCVVMRKRVHLLHLQLDVGVDVGVGEHAALGQEGAVLVQVVERLVQAVADGRDLRVLFRRQVVQVLGGGLARVDLVLARRPGRPSAARRSPGTGCISGSGKRASMRRPFGLATYGMRIEAERFLRRVGQLHRRLEARHQALVAVGARVGDRVQRAGVLDDAADVVQRELATGRRSRRRRTGSCRPSRPTGARACREPLSPTIGLGMKVAVLP